MLWAETRLEFTILSLLVWKNNSLGLVKLNVTDLYLATSGACATIASDALMNPFDGKLIIKNIFFSVIFADIV